ncbi:hypothetical protein LB452_13055 [Psychroflexus sp. CAK8W]|uniref:HNH endonuclease n=1 Tax=Psychroflexus longus TaxID=2873596 RepID=A0ABS7XLI7_9FLAO|nr:hypothetical protein [Psychroflexus longus]MBZ9779850.1 hypothetical protein [Psychroflexus longus]
MNYNLLLKTDEWKEKRNEILSRDNKTCQRCGFLQNDKTLTPSLTIEKKTFENSKLTFQKDQKILPNIVRFESLGLVFYCKTYLTEDNLKSTENYSMIINLVKKKKIEYPFQGSLLKDTRTNFFLTETVNESLKKYAQRKANDSSLEMDLEGIWFTPFSERIEYAKLTKSLHVHHKCYRKNQDIWDQNNEEYVTLCNVCHKIIHESNQIPFYDSKGINYKFRKPCTRCKGTRYLPQYSYVDNGICYKCNGYGYLN